MANEFVYSEVDYNFIYSEVDVPTNGSLFITASDNNSNNYKWGYTSQDIIVPITDSTGTYYESGSERVYINPGEVIEYKNSENTIYIIPSLVKIHPNLIITTGTKKTLQKNEVYRFSATNNFKLYYLQYKQNNFSEYINYYNSDDSSDKIQNPDKKGINWITELKIVPEELQFDNNTEIYLIVESTDVNESGQFYEYNKLVSNVSNKFSYYDATNKLKEISNYSSFKFENSNNNLHSLYSDGFDLSLIGMHFSKYKTITETKKFIGNKVVTLRPFVYTKEDLPTYNLQILNDKISFKAMLWFSMDNRSGHDSRIMTTIHNITGYNSDGSAMSTKKDVHLSDTKQKSDYDGDIEYTKLSSTLSNPLWHRSCCNFFPVGWGTLSDDDGTRVSHFKRGSTNVYLQGMYAVDHSSISSTCTLGYRLFKANASDQIIFTDNWVEKGARKHAADVLALLTNLYWKDGEYTKDSTKQVVTDCICLTDNYTIYNQDVIVKLFPSYHIKNNANDLITMKGINYKDYVSEVKKQLNVNINDTNTICVLDDILKVAPISFKFDYIISQPEIDNSDDDDDEQELEIELKNVFDNDPTFHKFVQSGGETEPQANRIYAINSNNEVVNIDKITSVKKLSTSHTITDGNHLTITGYSGSLGVDSNILGSAYIYNPTTATESETHYVGDMKILVFTNSPKSTTTWKLHSSYNGRKKSGNEIYITKLPCNSSANTQKIFT